MIQWSGIQVINIMHSRRGVKQERNFVDDPRYGECIGALKKWLLLPLPPVIKKDDVSADKSFAEFSDELSKLLSSDAEFSDELSKLLSPDELSKLLSSDAEFFDELSKLLSPDKLSKLLSSDAEFSDELSKLLSSDAEFSDKLSKLLSSKLFPNDHEEQWIKDWSRSGTISIIDTDNERSQFKIKNDNGCYILKKGDDEDTVITLNHKDTSRYRSVLEKMGFSNTMQDFIVKYAHQSGFFNAIRMFHEQALPCIRFGHYDNVDACASQSDYWSIVTLNTNNKYSFKLESEKVVFITHSTISGLRIIDSIVEPETINFSQPIEIEASVDILTVKDIEDKNRMQNSKINYFGFGRDKSIDEIDQLSYDESEYLEFGTQQDKLKMDHSCDNVDSDLDSDVDSGIHDNGSNDSDIESNDNGIRLGDDTSELSENNIIVGDAQEEEETKALNGMVLFDHRFQKFDLAGSNIKNSILCADQLCNDFNYYDIGQEKQSMFFSTKMSFDFATLCYPDWRDNNEGKSFFDYLEAKRPIYQPMLDRFILEAKSQMNKQEQLSEEEEKTKKATESALKTIAQAGGLKSVYHQHQQRQQDLKNLKSEQAKLMIVGGTCAIISILSSFVCFITVTGKTEMIGSKVFPTAQIFSNPAHVAILSVVGVLALVATIVTGSAFYRVSTVNEKIRSEEQNLHLAEPVVSSSLEEARLVEAKNSISQERRGPTIN